jgi:hypothetical protein
MTSFSVKLVDHTSSHDKFKARIRKEIQDLFDQLFDGSTATVTVDWGTYAPSDLIVLHFVADIAGSYILQKFPGGKSISPGNAGFTRTRDKLTGSEFYKYVVIDGKRTMVKDIGYAKAAVHEAMHNQFPYWTDDDMHGKDGGGGLASYPPTLPITSKNKELMQRAITFKGKIAQLP